MHIESIKNLLAAIETKDTHTEGHSIHVAELAVDISRSMNLDGPDLVLIEFAGLLHDVGKIVIPEYILKKTSALSEAEWTIIKKHTIYSARLIEPIGNLRQIRKWVLYHHERWDGKGYPEGIKGESIPLAARILSVCDAFSAMISDRPYRKALHHDFALRELMQAAGSQLDPDIVKVFIRLMQPAAPAKFRRD